MTATAKKASVQDRLLELDKAGERHDGTETFIFRPAPSKRHASGYLAGVPYLWTQYAERAFIFRDKAQAESLIREFPDDLAGCEARQFKPKV